MVCLLTLPRLVSLCRYVTTPRRCALRKGRARLESESALGVRSVAGWGGGGGQGGRQRADGVERDAAQSLTTMACFLCSFDEFGRMALKRINSESTAS